MSEFGSLNELVKWLVYSGGAVLVVSWLLDRFPWFLRQVSQVKYWIAMICSVIASLACYALLTYMPAETWKLLDPWFLITSGTIASYSVMQIYHRITKP
jgi:hypothetical protein